MFLIKIHLVLLIFCLLAIKSFAQVDANRVAPGAVEQFTQLLNKPAMVKATVVTPLGKNWFTVESDVHVFSDQVTFGQIAKALVDIENYTAFFDGRRSKLLANVISRTEEGVIADYVTVVIAGPLRLRTPYRAVSKVILNTDTKFAIDVRQTPEDSASNTKIKKVYAIRYTEEVTINGKNYTYVRMYTIEDADASILPGAKGVLERNSAPINQEAIQALINMAKTK